MAQYNIKRDYVFMPGGLNLGWFALHEKIPTDANKCYLVALDNRQLSVLHDLLSITKWYWLWNIEHDDEYNRLAAKEFVYELEKCLMSGCNVQDLIKTNRMLIAAITGQSVDLTSELPTGTVNYADVGLAAMLRKDDDTLAEIMIDIKDTLDALKAEIEALTGAVQNGEGLGEYLDDVEEAIDAVNVILGGAAVLGL